MNAIFVRLYLIIVISILAVGLSMDFVWQKISAPSTSKSEHEILLDIVTQQLSQLPPHQQPQKLAEIIQLSDIQFDILSPQDFGGQLNIVAISEQQAVYLDGENQHYLIKQLPASDQYLQMTIAVKSGEHSTTRTFLLVGFYGLIAIMVYVWVHPLARDLSRLETLVKNFDAQQWQTKIDLSDRSPIKHLANAYNQLLDKIKNLIETQKEMSHAISHELRTPLARVRFALEMAQLSKDQQSTRAQLESIGEDVAEMSGLIDELLNFASLEHTNSVAKFEQGNINQLLGNLCDRIARNQPQKQIAFIKNTSSENMKQQDSNDLNIFCDSYLIERAVQNLVVNATSFSQSQVKVSFYQLQHENQIWVEDDGPGIAAENRDKIFESFVRLKNNDKRQGFGLGLAIVRRIAKLHHGKIAVFDSTLGGAKFVLSWPVSYSQIK